MIDAQAAADPEAFRREAATVLAEAGPRLRRLREDPELERLASDPEVAALLERGEVLGLLRHPRFRTVVARALSEPATL
jgi:hypothetical protein